MVYKQSQAVKPTPTKATKTVVEEDQDQAELTVVASLQAVKHLVETSLGCLTYLRGIFPDDHFSDEYVPGGRVTSTSSEKARKNGSIKVKKLGRGHSSEGDRFLDYWDGVQDSLDHEYLSSLIIAVYLDPNEPENLVESYTFNFAYTDVPGSSKKAVSMDVEEQMRGVSIFDNKKEPVNPTARDVRSSTQSIIRSLITLTQCLPELPRKRFITLKLFYTDDTPPDYEPPRFRASAGHNFVFRSRHLTEGPDQADIGPLLTGHHGVSVSIASLTHLLPPSIQEDDEEEVAVDGEKIDLERRKAIDHQAQLEDAAKRRVVWDAEEKSLMGLSRDPQTLEAIVEEEDATPVDAEERDRRTRTGVIRRRGDPLGIISSAGKLRPIPRSAREEALQRQQRRNQGEKVKDEDIEDVEMFVAKIVEKEWTSNPRADLARSTTSNSMAQTVYDSRSVSNGVGPGRSTSPQDGAGVNYLPELEEDEMSIESQTQSQSYSTRPTKKTLQQESEDPIESFSTQDSTSLRSSPRKKKTASQSLVPKRSSQALSQIPGQKSKPGYFYEPILEEDDDASQEQESQTNGKEEKNGGGNQEEMMGITCLCEDLVEDGLMAQCEATECIEKGSGWVHAACYGFTDKTIDQAQLFCYDHELQVGAFPSEDIDSVRISVLNKLASLALMRRALHVIHRDGWLSGLTHFAAKIGCDLRTATEVATSLENEGYIVKFSKEEKSKRKQSKSSKNNPSHYILKHRQIIKKKDETYFTPKGGVEAEILSLWTQAGGLLMSDEKTRLEPESELGSQLQNNYPSSAQRSKGVTSEAALFENSQNNHKSSQRATSPPTEPVDMRLRSLSELSDIGIEEARMDLNSQKITATKKTNSSFRRVTSSAQNSAPANDVQMSGLQEESFISNGNDNSSPSPMTGDGSRLQVLPRSNSIRAPLASSSSPVGRKRSRIDENADEEMGEVGQEETSVGSGTGAANRSSSYNLRARKRPTKDIKTSMTAGIELDDIEMD